MPFARPALAELVSRTRADFRGRLSLIGALLRGAMVEVLGAVWGGAAHLMHGHLAWASEQIIHDKSEREYMLRNAGMYSIFPTPATYASGEVTATGENDVVIEVDEIIVREDGVQ